MERFYGKAVVWAAKNGIAKGVSTTVFAPHAPVTREQMVTFLYRYANLAGEDVTGDYDLTELATMEPFTTMPRNRWPGPWTRDSSPAWTVS